jgi:6-pyruvoyltetrahydropterin/6-carboxytetrahydropterin synthase
VLTITKEFEFSASHRIVSLPSWHKCARHHGHNYVVALELSAPPERLDEHGFVRDYGDLADFRKWVDETLDHQHLNNVEGTGTTSSERLAMWIYGLWLPHYPELTGVVVKETPKTSAAYRPRRLDALSADSAGVADL